MEVSEAWQKPDTRYKITLISTLLVGVAAQGMGLFNKFSVHDDVAYYGIGATYRSGRWMLDLLGQLETKIFGDYHFSLPTFNGLLGLLFIAAAACLIVRILDLKSRTGCAFVGGLMAAFPVVTSMFGYMFTLHFYLFGMLMGVTGAWLICEQKNWLFRVSGILLIGASVGVYQAFLPVSMCVILLSMIRTAAEETELKSTLKKILNAGVCGILGAGFYFAANKLFLQAKQIALTDYKGINTAAEIPLRVYLARIGLAYREFFFPNPNPEGWWYVMVPLRLRHVYLLLLAISILLSVMLICRIGKQDRGRGILLAVLICLFPLCVNFIFVMVAQEELHSLMMYAQLFPFVFFVWLLEKTELKNPKFQKTVSAAAAAVLALTLLLYVRIDNKCYLKATYAQQEAISYFTMLATQIKNTEGYRDEMPVAFLHEREIQDQTIPGDSIFQPFHTLCYLPYALDARDYVNDWNWKNFMAQWCGFEPALADAAAFEALEEVRGMPHYPDDGSIRIIDDTVIVNF